MNGLSLVPIYLVDFFGSGAMIVLSFIALYYSFRLTQLESKSVIWTYLFWLCLGMAAVALTRGIGHIFRFLLVLAGHGEIWETLAPISGSLNTMTFVSITTLTFYYPNIRLVMERVREDARRLASAHASLQELNQTLERRVEERTQALRLSEEKFRHLFENSKDVIFFCDADRRLRDINDSGVDLLGYAKKEDLIGRPLSEFFAEEINYQQFQQRLCSQGHVKDFEADFQRFDGSATLTFIISADIIRDEKGKTEGWEGIAKDITRFKQVMTQLMQSEKMASVGQLAAGVAHEINTPLGIILGYTQLLQDDIEGDGEVHETLAIIEKQTKVCKRIVADLLKFSRESVKNVIAEIDVNQCLEEVLSVTEHSLNMDRIYVHRSFAESVPKIMGDAGKLQQVFLNLITNAHQAMEKDGIIGIWTRPFPDGKGVEVIVGDSGPGIPPEIRRKIFEPFFTTKGVGKGTGLGLSVTFGIVREHGGTIEVESPPGSQELVSAGMETVFIVRLPVQRLEGDKSLAM